MIAFIIYFLLVCFLIYKTGFFGLLKDAVLTPRFYLGAFLLKCAGIGVFYVVYYVFYGSTDYADTYNFMHDAKIIRDVANWNFTEFLKIMFGLQDESETTDLYKNFIVNTNIWNKNPNEFFYNDNRVVVRLHALFHFISFQNYFVHSLLGVLLSFIGIHFIYKTFKTVFLGKEVLLFLVWIVFPGTFFWTSGVLKEAPALFLMGLLLFSLKNLFLNKKINLRNALLFIICVVMCFFFKQYIMLPLLFLSLLFFSLVSLDRKRVALLYLVSIVLLFILGNLLIKSVYKRSALSVIAERQHTFLDMSRGGLFLTDNEKFVRLPYNFDLVKIDSLSALPTATIKKDVPFVYWEHTHQQDTLYSAGNTDTLHSYKVEYIIAPAKQTIQVDLLSDNYVSLLKAIPSALYFTLFKPLFYDARNTLDLLASIENVLILVCLVIVILIGFRKKEKQGWIVFFLSITFCILLIIGLTSPNPGAIVRYRALVIPFLLMSTLLALPVKETARVFKFFKRNSQE